MKSTGPLSVAAATTVTLLSGASSAGATPSFGLHPSIAAHGAARLQRPNPNSPILYFFLVDSVPYPRHWCDPRSPSGHVGLHVSDRQRFFDRLIFSHRCTGRH
jgi:hypothetical protein